MTNPTNEKALTIEKNVQKVNLMNNKKRFIWKQTYLQDNKLVTVEINMNDLDAEHLNKANLKCQRKMHELYKEIIGWEDLLEKLEEIAEKKNISLESINSNFLRK